MRLDPHEEKFPQGDWYFRYQGDFFWSRFEGQPPRLARLFWKRGRFYVYLFYGIEFSWRFE